MTKTLTDMQYALMNLIAHHEMNTTNGATPEKHSDVNTWLWADEFAKELSLTEEQVGGLLTTLTEAELIGVHKAKKKRGQPDESTVWFTEAGFLAWQAVHNGAKETKTTKQKKATKAVVETKKEQTVTNTTTNLIDLLADREGSRKRAAAQVLLKNQGKAVSLAKLAEAVYSDPEFTAQIGMVLKGIAKAIEVQGLTLTLTREKGNVTLSSLEPVAPKAKRTSKKSIADFLPNNSEESINIRSKRSRKAA
jgi:hypothetical protein